MNSYVAPGVEHHYCFPFNLQPLAYVSVGELILLLALVLDYLFLLSHAFSPSCGRVCTLSCDHVHHAKLIGRARYSLRFKIDDLTLY